MAIKLADEYTQVTPPDLDYPQGSFLNSTTPTSTDGTPVDKLWGDDMQGFFQAIMLAAGLTPSGVPDTARVSQYLQGLMTILGVNAGAIRTVVADDTALPTDIIIELDGSANTVDFTLLSSADVGARAIIFQRKSTDSGTFAVTILPDGAETLAGESSRTLLPGESTKFVPDGGTNYLEFSA